MTKKLTEFDSRLRVLVVTKTGEKAGGARTYESSILQLLNHISHKLPMKLMVAHPSEVPFSEGEVNSEADAQYSNSRWGKLRSVLASTRIGHYLARWIDISPMSPIVRRLKPDVIYFTSTNLHAMPSFSTPALFTVWDLGHRQLTHFPEFAKASENWLRERLYVRALSHSFATFTDSEFTGRTLERSYSVSPEKWVSLGMALVCEENIDEPPLARGEPYFLYPAQKWPHKNHSLLLDAIVQVRKVRPEVQLILTGSSKRGSETLDKKIQELSEAGAVKDFGFVSNDRARELIRNAAAITMPTYLGPTNLPPLEAAVHGVRSIVSNVHHFDEQITDYLIALSPDSPELWAHAMLSVLDLDRLPPWKIESPAQERIGKVLKAIWHEKSRQIGTG